MIDSSLTLLTSLLTLVFNPEWTLLIVAHLSDNYVYVVKKDAKKREYVKIVEKTLNHIEKLLLKEMPLQCIILLCAMTTELE